MINNTPSLDLVEFIETQILPRYAAFDRAHNMEHVTRVTATVPTTISEGERSSRPTPV